MYEVLECDGDPQVTQGQPICPMLNSPLQLLTSQLAIPNIRDIRDNIRIFVQISYLIRHLACLLEVCILSSIVNTMATLSENNNNQADFNSDQAAILQDLARNGAADEAHMYGYGEANLQSNGANPSVDFTFSAAYPSTGLSNSFQDMEDPAALLESLASFEHPPPSNEGPTPGSNDHFESLLQAVERAEGQAGPPKEHGQTGRNSTPRRTEQHGFSQKSPLNENRSKRRRDEDEDDGRTFGFIKTSRSSKRQKQSVQDEDEEQLAKEREIWGPEENDEQDGSTAFEYQHSPIATADARAVGVHSAAALFRRPSTASKKYTSKFRSDIYELKVT